MMQGFLIVWAEAGRKCVLHVLLSGNGCGRYVRDPKGYSGRRKKMDLLLAKMLGENRVKIDMLPWVVLDFMVYF
jgi:hypothetical protein